MKGACGTGFNLRYTPLSLLDARMGVFHVVYIRRQAAKELLECQ